jgi:hypothetical protein
MNVFIYALCDPSTFEVRYIGKTINPYKRYYSHLSARSLNRRIQTHKTHWLKSLLRQSLLPIQQILEICDERNWEQKESEWIAFYKSIGCNLTNGTPGGYGWFKCSGKSRKGRKLSEEWRAKISKTLKGRKLPDEHRKNISKNHARKGKFGKDCPIFGSHHSDETKRKMSESQKLRDPKTRATWTSGGHHTEEAKLRIGRTEKITKANKKLEKFIKDNHLHLTKYSHLN